MLAIGFELSFNPFFQYKFEAGFLLVATKLIKLAMDLIEKFEFDRKRSKKTIYFDLMIKLDFFY